MILNHRHLKSSHTKIKSFVELVAHVQQRVQMVGCDSVAFCAWLVVVSKYVGLFIAICQLQLEANKSIEGYQHHVLFSCRKGMRR